MEQWEIEFKWLEIRHFLKDRFRKNELPDLKSTLFLIGLRELGKLEKDFTKEQKQDLMHVGTCTVMAKKGYFELTAFDDDRWPHFTQTKALPKLDLEGQEIILKEAIVQYFIEEEILSDHSSR